MIIRPLDLQVLIPRTTDAGKMAAVIDQQPATQQQQISAQLKQAANERQQQVKTALQKSHAGSVSTEDLNQQKQKERQHGRNDTENSPGGDNSADQDAKNLSASVDPMRGRTIDIKT